MRNMVGVDITFPPWYSNGPVGLFDPSVGLYVLPALPTRFSSLSLQLFCPDAFGFKERILALFTGTSPLALKQEAAGKNVQMM